MRRPVAVVGEHGRDRGARGLVVGPAELDPLQEDHDDHEGGRHDDDAAVDALRLEDHHRAEDQQRRKVDQVALLPQRREDRREVCGLDGGVERERADRRRGPGDVRAVDGFAAAVRQPKRREPADHGQRPEADREREPRPQTQVDEPVLVVLARHLPLVDVLQDDAVEQEERSDGEHHRPDRVAPRPVAAQLATARPGQPESRGGEGKGDGQAGELLLADEVAADERDGGDRNVEPASRAKRAHARAMSRARSRGRRRRRGRSRWHTPCPGTAIEPTATTRAPRRLTSMRASRYDGMAASDMNTAFAYLIAPYAAAVEWSHQAGAIRYA